MSNTQLLINQRTGHLDPRVFVNCLQVTKTLGSKRPAVDWLIVVYCSSVNFTTSINAIVSLYSIMHASSFSFPFSLCAGGCGNKQHWWQGNDGVCHSKRLCKISVRLIGGNDGDVVQCAIIVKTSATVLEAVRVSPFNCLQTPCI